MVHESGSGDVSGSGGYNEDGKAVLQDLDLSFLSPRERARFLKEEQTEFTGLSSEQKRELEKAFPAIRFQESMKAHTTLGVGGKAEAYVEVQSVEMLKSLFEFLKDSNIPYYLIGKGSNTLVRDGGVKGVVIQLLGDFQEYKVEQESGDDVFVSVGAGVSTLKLVRWANEQHLAGIERLSGVPGTLGGNILTNAGTHIGSIDEIVEEVTMLDKHGKEMTQKVKSIPFEYRRCKLPRGTIVLKALLKLQKDPEGKAAQHFKELMERRRETQPISQKSSGCMFKNDGKQAAAKLIDEAGLKGVRVGGARISDVHANYIVNEANASARDVIVLMGLVRDRVRQHSGVVLENEIFILGEEK
ncbi:MAG: UDP-N-acetylenolpyruvoylglucosamine reductase [Deltaproteobacteria bacterium CG_4_10_14_0_2_um_filter_43_8]|nr:MAG: UDP-N-acetylenolpyruvoylglucosamine reductase [Deltaproteobacteria bacterium CG11_big_fil_rev_8_21_14_0_20_42_23]PJA19629.1 MAG: UDP-N-acetylenolpyruvoylglucosamine reductase [Deltaproteobacteria bacterium CG_4_10_14_0_2_um_filter_43_8]PJC65097.1 MAG: UDP-N-acetylenolpyruvoylglucosamine reductase [Deltaproteobacteria bacterium CG_4_9_14_0_2_um_filter_42_21]